MSAQHIFSHAAQKPPPTRFDFHDAVAGIYTMFPALQDSVFFVDIGKGQIAHPRKETLDELLDFVSNSEPGKQFLQPKIAECQKHKVSYCHMGGGSTFVYLYTAEDRRTFFSGPTESAQAQELFFVLDHELGHAIVPNGSSDNRFMAENAADAFALLRHVQRFGDDTGMMEKLLLFRARDTAFRENGIFNFSCPLLEHVLGGGDGVDIRTLDPQQTIDYANSLADRFAPSAELLKSLHAHFAPLQKEKSLSALANVAVTTEDADVLKWSATVLKGLLAKQISAPAGQDTEADKTLPTRMTHISSRLQKMSPSAP